MTKFLTLFALLLFAMQVCAQRPEADHFKTPEGDLTIQPVLHGALMIQFDGKTIYVDPYGGSAAFDGLDKPDLILITDSHGDHLDEKTLDGIKAEGMPIVAPQAVKDKMSEKYKNSTSVVNNGESHGEMGILIEAIPMYNLPESPDEKHVKG